MKILLLMAKRLKKNKFISFQVKIIALISISLIVIYMMSSDDMSDEIRLAIKNQTPHANPHDFK